MTGSDDRLSPQLLRVLITQIPRVALQIEEHMSAMAKSVSSYRRDDDCRTGVGAYAHLVQNSVRERRSRSDREDVSLEPRSVRVDVVQRWSLGFENRSGNV